jgi:hypothetical protein
VPSSRYTADADPSRARLKLNGDAMRRLPMILPCLMLLAACADAPPSPTIEQGVRASFPPGAVVNVIRVDALDSLPLRAADLVAPDGTVTSASSLDVQKSLQTNGGESTVNDPWRSSMLGNNGIPQLPSGQLTASVRTHDTLMAMVSTAQIPLPDPAAYRQDWANYRIRLSFGAGGSDLDTREIAAPRPPPS